MLVNEKASKFDYASEAWSRIRRDVEADRAESRERLECPGLDPIRTEFQRGYVAALTELLARADRALAPAMDGDPEDDSASPLLAGYGESQRLQF